MNLARSCNLCILSPFYDNIFPQSDMLELDFIRFIMFLRRIESTILDLGDGMQKVYAKIRPSGNNGRRFLWNILHLIFSIWYYLHGLVNAIKSLLISSGLFQRYKSLDISKVRYLAVVIDSEEALNTLKVLELLRWLQTIGLKNVCLYDTQGLLKISKEALALWLKRERMSNETTSEPLEQKCMIVDILSFSDGKHAVAKATNFLLKKHYLGADTEKKTNLTESDMTDALAATGYGGADPDLMLVYGPARCHMGFPAWRIRYTEIVHMGPLKSMKFGALIKAIHRFTMVHQNYGT